MLRWLVATGFLITLPAMAAGPVSVAQLEHLLQQDETARKSDGAIAEELSQVALSERLTAASLQRIISEVKAGPQTAQALDLLGDESALLAPPATEIPADGRPDMASQRAMFTAAIDYVVKTLHHLPDFLAVRETRSFDDVPSVVGHSGYAPIVPLHLVGTFHRNITYRSGQEMLEREQEAAKGRKESEPRGLQTWGEFGPVLGIILGDSLKGNVTWSRWEQVRNGGIAVFRYAVPAKASHYHVDFCCVWHDYEIPENGNALSYRGTPAYHGELFIEPKTGAVVGVTLEAELGSTEVIRRAAISVQYGPMEIGGKEYICPTRSVAISETMDRPGKVVGGTPPVTRINETTFIGYHRFGSTSRILAGIPSDLPPTTTAPQRSLSSPETASTAKPTKPLRAESTETPQPTAAPPPRTTPNTPVDQGTPAVEQKPVLSDSGTQPSKPEPTAEVNVPTTPVLKTTTREVVLDVVITKNNGDPVKGLMKQDFVVTEDGQSESIDFFEEHAPGERPQDQATEMPPLPTGAVTNVPPAAVDDAVNVLLLDSLNTPPQDQANVQRQILDFVRKMKPGTPIAVFTLGTRLHFVQGFTTDSAVLLSALKGEGFAGEKNGSTRSDAADDASHIANLRTMQTSEFAITALQNAEAEARSADLGAHAAMTFEALSYLAHYLSGVPGRKNLLWFSSTFPVVIFPSEEESKRIEKNREYVQRMKQTADLFSATQISVYPIGAEGMMTEHLMEADVAGPAAPEGTGHFGGGSQGTMQAYNAEAAGRAQAVGAMEQLAASTGGKAFYNTNDLDTAMQKAIEDGARYYTIGYSPAYEAMDGAFRRIDVRVNKGKYKLAYRRGYNAEERPAPDPKADVNPLTDLLAFGLPAATGILYGVDTRRKEAEDTGASPAGQNAALHGPLTRYRINFIIRASDVSLTPDAQGMRSGRILVGLRAYGHDGQAVNWEATDETLRVPEKEYAAALKSGIPLHLDIDVPANGEDELVTAVYDWSSGRAGTLDVHLSPNER